MKLAIAAAVMNIFDSPLQWIQNTPAIEQWAAGGAIILVAFLLGWIGVNALFFALRRIVDHAQNASLDIILEHIKGPTRILLPLFALKLGVVLTAIPEEHRSRLEHGLTIGIILTIGYGASRTIQAMREIILKQQNISATDNLRARRATTQTRVLSRVVIFIVWIIALSAMLMTFSGIRELGVSLLASAGITGIVVGFAAQKTLGNLIAGIQIAFTQPIRIDDVVIVENEWGRIEEITLTFVVVRIWDQRRLVLPITYFVENPFQNWTRVSADILGAVYLYTDYTLPLEAIRQETQRIAEKTDLWDGKLCIVQVTDCKPQVMETRLLLSAVDSSTAWQLKCHVREQILRFIQRDYSHSLPRVRASLHSTDTQEAVVKTHEQ